MKTTRTFASVCLTASCIALVVAANVSVGDQPGVFRMTSTPQDGTPDVDQNGVYPPPGTSAGDAGGGEAAGQVNLNGGDTAGQVMMNGGNNVPFMDPGQFMSQSAGVTEPIMGAQVFEQPLFGPQITFDQTIDDSLGMQDSYTRFNAFIPSHLVDNTSILAGSISASLTANGNDIYNFGALLRHYDEVNNRILGVNFFGDYDSTALLGDNYSRIGFGFESLSQYFDFILNGYVNTGSDGVLSSRTAISGLTLAGHNVVRSFSETRENVYQGLDWKIGTPIPWLGRRGLKFFGGSYYLTSKHGAEEALGLSLQFQLQATESLEVNAYYTNDEVFGTNSWVNIAYSIPHIRQRRVLRPKTVRERLTDPVRRTNTIHTNLETAIATSAVINPKTGLPFFINYVDPNATTAGPGTVESPYMTLEMAKTANSATVDAIRITPRDDGTGTNLTVAGGLDLFAEQAVFSSHKDFTLFSEAGSPFVIPGVAGPSGAGPLVSNPTMVAGGSVIRVSDWNRINGLQIDAANSAGTVFGMGIDGPGTIDGIHVSCNVFTNYTTAVNLPAASDELLFDDNTFSGLAGVSQTGLELTTVAGTHSLRIARNTATNNATAAVNVTAPMGSTISADDPLGIGGGTATGVIDNNVSAGGQGMVFTAAGGTINAVVERNTSTDNTFNGFIGRADDGVFNLASMRENTMTGNLENGTFLHFLNGGTFRAVTEDLNGNGIIDAGEDLNGNGMLDEGIAANTMSNNRIAGLCLFGEDDSTGDFAIGGPIAALGNTFNGNSGAGVAVDLQDSSTAGIDALFNTISGGSSGPASLTIVLDFIDPAQAPVTDVFGVQINPFDVTNYGFAAGDFDVVTNAVLETVRSHYSNIPTVSQDARSPIADGFQLDIDFVIGDNGVAPSNGATDYYVINIGDANGAAGGGVANNIGNVRDANGNGPNPDIFGTPTVIGDDVAQVYADSLTTFGPLVPANAFTPDFIPQPLSEAPDHAAIALTSGNLTFTRRALGLVTSHEIGHTLSLRHVDDTGAVTPTGQTPIMGTPAPPFLLPIQTLIEPAEFAFSADHLPEGPNDPPFVQNSIAQLASAVGLRTGGSPQANGITVVANDSARLRESTMINNEISGSTNNGINVEMNDMAVAEDITIQGNNLVGNGTGVRLAANGPGAVINADSTIGGTGINVFRGVSFNQGNTITNSTGDGFRALASDGGTILGNLLNNNISNNGGNGASLLIDGGGTIDFGTPASNRIISGNTFDQNSGYGIFASSNVDVTVPNSGQAMDIVIQGNTVTGNLTGGIFAELSGLNNTPPGPPAAGFDQNNILNLTVGQSTAPFGTAVASESNTITGNTGVGVGLIVAGTGKANVSIVQNTITGTISGTDPLFNGDGIHLRRHDSSLLTGSVLYNTVNENASDGLQVVAQGTGKNNQNQPMSGMANSVTWNNNILNSNGGNGAYFDTQGDAQLFGDGMANVLTGNSLSGILVRTSENSSFGDPTDRRTVFSGIISTLNGRDGIELISGKDDLDPTLISSEASRLLLEITSSRIDTTSGAHAALNTMGNTVLSNNGRDGVHIETRGVSVPDILITAETPVTPNSATTVISGNGTNNTLTILAGREVPTAVPFLLTEDLLLNFGGNGIYWESYEAARGTVQVYNTSILGNLAGSSDDINEDGILTFQEDLFGRFAQNYYLLGADPGSELDDLEVYTEGNLDIDVLGGDGIQFNYFQSASSTLVVGAAGMGNRIQSNEDDGIALTGDSRRVTLETTPLGDDFRQAPGPVGFNTSPTIEITANIIGGERDGLPAGNGGDGVSIRSYGFTGEGVPTDEVDSDLDDGDGFDPSGIDNPAAFDGGGAADLGSEITSGPIPDIRLVDNTITQNNRIGVNIRLNGGAGRFDRRVTPVVTDPFEFNTEDYNQITLIGNTISSNGEEGVFLRADADMNQNRIVFTPNTDPDLDGTFDTDNRSPADVAAFSDFPANDVDASLPYLNLATVQNTLFTATGNTIQNNGTNTVTGEGIEIRVGTSTYVAADIRDNIFGGNLQADLYTGAIYSKMDFTNDDSGWKEERFDSVDNDGEFLFDVVRLDDAALLDMRFTGNTGDQINPQENGAFLGSAIPFVGATPDVSVAIDVSGTYVDPDNSDPIRGGGPAGVFKIDNAFGLDAPGVGNSFIELGIPRPVVPEFFDYEIRNLSTEPIWPEDPFQDAD